MIGAAAATSASPYPILDGVLALSLVVHSHIGVSDGGVGNRLGSHNRQGGYDR